MVKFTVSSDLFKCSIHKKALIGRIPDMEHTLQRTGPTESSRENRGYNPQEGVFNWEHVEVSFFDGFFQYVYTGSYIAPAPEPMKSQPFRREPTVAPHDTQHPSKYFDEQLALLKMVNEARRSLLLRVFHAEYSIYADDCALRHDLPLNSDQSESYAMILYYHMNMHWYATGFDLPELATLANAKLYQTLVQFELHDQGAADLVKLLELISDEDDDTADSLCVSMLHHFLVCHWDTLSQFVPFRNIFFCANIQTCRLLRQLSANL